MSVELMSVSPQHVAYNAVSIQCAEATAASQRNYNDTESCNGKSGVLSPKSAKSAAHNKDEVEVAVSYPAT